VAHMKRNELTAALLDVAAVAIFAVAFCMFLSL